MVRRIRRPVCRVRLKVRPAVRRVRPKKAVRIYVGKGQYRTIWI